MTLPSPTDWPVDPAALDDLAGGERSGDRPSGDEPAPDLLAERTRSTPEAQALVDVDGGERWTYAAFDRVVDRWAARLAAELDGDRPRIGLCLGAPLAFATTYFAAARLGSPVVPLNLELDRERLATQTGRAAVGLVVAEPDTADLARHIAPTDCPTLCVDADDPEAVATGPGRSFETAARSPERERVVMFTSGTTGDPKGVRLTVRNLVASAVGSAARLGVDTDDRWLAPLPTYHMGGLAPLVRSTLYGTTTVLQRSFDAAATAAVVARHDVTALSLVPTMLVRLLDDGWHPPDHLRFVLLGGAPATPDLIERALDREVPVSPTYGLTETASQVATATPAEVRDHPDTVGRPISTATVTVHDDGPCEPGETGDILVDGPVVTPGYLDAERTEAAFGEWGLRTGDLGYRDEDGRLWVVGRRDDRIVTGGENVHPERVADAIRDLDGIDDAAVVGLPDEEWGERVVALVVGERSPAEIRRALRDSLADYEIPKTIVGADVLPRTASGTVDRDAVRHRLEDA